ncbi:response regulator [bacterium]|nr:response regulator [bacterium]
MGHTVLIADDADFMRAMLRDILENMGMKVVGEAADAEETIKEFRRLRPQIVMLDITLPDADGLEALTGILTADPEAQVVLVAPLGQRNLVLSGIKAGAKDFIIKPFDENRVAATVANLLQGSPA